MNIAKTVLALFSPVRETASKVRLSAAELIDLWLQVIKEYDAEVFCFHYVVFILLELEVRGQDELNSHFEKQPVIFSILIF